MMDMKTWLAAIRASTDDDTPRLACADWLEECGQRNRAEFIRVQCRLARMEGDDPRRPALTRREDELLAEHALDWEKEIPERARHQVAFHRGFVSHVECRLPELLSDFEAVLACAPLTSVGCWEGEKSALGAFARNQHLAGFQDLKFEECDLEGIALVLNSPHTSRLRGLTFSTNLEWPASVVPLFRSTGFDRITRLTVRYAAFSAADIRAFRHLPTTGQLDTFCLADISVNDSIVQEFVTGPRLPNLKRLGLEEGLGLTWFGVSALVSSPHVSELRVLSLRDHTMLTEAGNDSSIDDTAIRCIAESQNLHNLTDLDLRDTGVKEPGLRALLESPNLPRLSRIDLTEWPGMDEQFPVQRWKRPKATGCTVWVAEAKNRPPRS